MNKFDYKFSQRLQFNATCHRQNYNISISCHEYEAPTWIADENFLINTVNERVKTCSYYEQIIRINRFQHPLWAKIKFYKSETWHLLSQKQKKSFSFTSSFKIKERQASPKLVYCQTHLKLSIWGTIYYIISHSAVIAQIRERISINSIHR